MGIHLLRIPSKKNDFASAIWICACIFFIEIIVIPHVFAMTGFHLKKNWKNLNRGGCTFACFYPFAY